MRALFDTNILIDYLRGIDAARAELARYTSVAISVITWMEVLIGAKDPPEETMVRRFLRRFDKLELTEAVAEEGIALRRRHRLKLPNAIIWASARRAGALLVTRNARDFPESEPGVRIPYRLAARI